MLHNTIQMKIYIKYVLILSLFSTTAFTQAFITTWNVAAAGDEITIPTTGTGYDYTVDWGDGATDNAVVGNITHSYASAGDYTVSITGQFPRIYFLFATSRNQILSVEQWGSQPWTSMNNAFRGCSNLSINATDTPDLSNVTDMSGMFWGASSMNESLVGWDVSNVTDMSFLFRDASTFNQDLTDWNVINVQTMRGMFQGASDFNGDITNWNTGNVITMELMFRTAYEFNQSIGAWDVRRVKNMGQLFDFASVFNQPLDGWDVDSVTTMYRTFANANLFNQNINNWNVETVTNMLQMFSSARAFNQPLDGWDVGNVLNMSSMFSNADVFNQDLDSWNVGNVTNMSSMFNSARAFNGLISNWDVRMVTNMSSMFREVTEFNQPLNGWVTENLLNTSRMFQFTDKFDQDLNNWDVSKVTNMESMFSWSIFNSNIADWDTGSAVDMSSLFRFNFVFNGDISGWNVENATDMNEMFSGASNFNQDISNWNVQNVINLAEIFEGASAFNYDVGKWNTASLQFAFRAFRDATSFNYELGDWDVSNMINITNMLDNSGMSIVNYDSTLVGWNALSTLPNNLTFGADGLVYCASETARDNIISTYNWVFSGDSFGCSNGEIAVFEDLSTNNLELFDGQTDAIDFGIQVAGIPAIGNFYIVNQGSGSLIITNVTAGNGDFSVSSLPSSNLLVDDTTYFEITFLSSVPGTFTENIIVESEDNDEGNFTFPATVQVTATAEPEIVVLEGISNDALISGATFPVDFGTVEQNDDRVVEFTIKNIGNDDLNISDINITGTNFTITSSPISTVLQKDSAIFELNFNSAVLGATTETITIISNDSDEGNFTFNVSAFVLTPGVPEISVFHDVSGTNVELFNGQSMSVDLGSVLQNGSLTKLFNLENSGSADLLITDVLFSGTNFSTASTLPVFVGIDDPTDNFIDITLNSSTIGDFNETVTIISNDPDNGSFSFPIRATVIASTNTPPIISSIADLNINEDETSGLVNFTISDEESNLDDLVLTATSDSLDLVGASGIILGGSGGDRNIQITPMANANGVTEITIEVTDDDGTTTSTSFTVTINAVNDAPIISGYNPLTTNQNTPKTVGLGDLTVADVDDNFPIGFSLNIQEGANYSVDGSLVIPAADFTGLLSVPITVNDGELNSPVFVIQITVEATGSSIGVAVAGEALANGSTISFNDVPVGASDLRELSITNSGAVPLTISAIAIDLADFIVSGSLPAPIAPSANALIAVKFKPTSIGMKRAILAIRSENSADFQINLTANGLEKAPPLEIFNVVTPLSDGKHDFLKIKNIEFYESNTVVIYSRWGKEVYAVNNYNNETNNFVGISKKGDELASGTYYYVINITGSEPLKGALLLQR